MSSEVDICNLALGYLGDSATVTSIDPPEGSAQAQHCARFFPIARDSLLQMHDWGFATRRVKPALLAVDNEQWEYSYAWPADGLQPIALIGDGLNYQDRQENDFYRTVYDYGRTFSPAHLHDNDVQVPYELESLPDGSKVILTDCEDVTLQYVASVKDTKRFTPLFEQALTWHLCSMLAGPIIKGDEGIKIAQAALAQVSMYAGKAMVRDANSKHETNEPIAGWMGQR